MKHTIRSDKHDGTGRIEVDNYTRGKAMAIHCSECMGWEDHPKDCTSPNCALFPFRKKTIVAYESQRNKRAKGES